MMFSTPLTFQVLDFFGIFLWVAIYGLHPYLYLSMFLRYGLPFGTRVLKTRVPERAF